MKKPVIIALVGPSGSGKTALGTYLENNCGIPQIASCTTRPMRPGEVQGREHTFVGVEDMPLRDEMLAYGEFGGHHYWVRLKDVDRLERCTYTIDDGPLAEMKRKYGDRYDILSVRIRRKSESGVDPERLRRDEGKFTLPDSFYDVVINNDGTLDEFLRVGSAIVTSLLKSKSPIA